MRPLSEIKKRMQVWQLQLQNHEFGKPDEIEEEKLGARISELRWVLEIE